MLHVFLVWPWNPKTNLQKSVFWNIEWFLSYLTFYPSTKVAPPLLRVEKKFLQNWPCRVSKEAEFCADFKNVQKSWVWQKGKNFYLKTEFLRTWKILQKMVFLRKNLWELLDARVLHIFEISAKFRFFWYPLCPVLKKFFSTLIRDSAIFWKLKGQRR